MPALYFRAKQEDFTACRLPNVPLLGAVWSLVDSIWDSLKGSWGVLALVQEEILWNGGMMLGVLLGSEWFGEYRVVTQHDWLSGGIAAVMSVAKLSKTMSTKGY